MSSPSESRRKQRLRGDPAEGGPFLTDLPDVALRHILGFTMPMSTERFDGRYYLTTEYIHCREQWNWTGQLAIVCRAFRELSRQVAPDSLIFSGSTDAAFLISFCENAWKRARIVKFEFMCAVDHTPARDAFLRLLEAPDSFPNLTKFHAFFSGRTGWRAITAPRFLYNLAQSCPNLSELSLYMPGGRWGAGARISPAQCDRFVQMLRRPLETLSFREVPWATFREVPWATDAHLCSFLHHHGQSLSKLHLGSCHSLSDNTCTHIAQHCQNLQELTLTSPPRVTIHGLCSVLQANGTLKELDISRQAALGPEVIPVLIQYAPQLERLRVNSFGWFTDDCLDQLVQGLIDHWAGLREQIPLLLIEAKGTGVSDAGADQVMAKPNVGHCEIQLRYT